MRASELFGIEGVYRAYLFDNAVGTFGRSLESALDDADGKTSAEKHKKQVRILARWLDQPLQYRSVGSPTAAVGPTADVDVEQVVTMTSVKGV